MVPVQCEQSLGELPGLGEEGRPQQRESRHLWMCEFEHVHQPRAFKESTGVPYLHPVLVFIADSIRSSLLGAELVRSGQRMYNLDRDTDIDWEVGGGLADRYVVLLLDGSPPVGGTSRV